MPIGQCVRVNADTMPCTYVVGVAEDIKQQSLGVDSALYNYYYARDAVQSESGRAVRAGERKRDARRRRHSAPSAARDAGRVVRDDDPHGADHRQQDAVVASRRDDVRRPSACSRSPSRPSACTASSRTTSRSGPTSWACASRLGAQAADLVRLVVTDGLRLAVAGVVIGAAVALYAARWVKPLLFDESPTDPLVFGGGGVRSAGDRGRRELAPRTARVEGRSERRTEIGVTRMLMRC